MRKIIGWALIVTGGGWLLMIPGAIRTMGLHNPWGTVRSAMVGGSVIAFLCGLVVVFGIVLLRSHHNRQ